MAATTERPQQKEQLGRSAWLWAQHLFVRLGVLPFLLFIAVVAFALMTQPPVKRICRCYAFDDPPFTWCFAAPYAALDWLCSTSARAVHSSVIRPLR